MPPVVVRVPPPYSTPQSPYGYRRIVRGEAVLGVGVDATAARGSRDESHAAELRAACGGCTGGDVMGLFVVGMMSVSSSISGLFTGLLRGKVGCRAFLRFDRLSRSGMLLMLLLTTTAVVAKERSTATAYPSMTHFVRNHEQREGSLVGLCGRCCGRHGVG
eukprot:scaffold2588_cov45-Cyclotella_meneghiniana.AAC.2